MCLSSHERHCKSCLSCDERGFLNMKDISNCHDRRKQLLCCPSPPPWTHLCCRRSSSPRPRGRRGTCGTWLRQPLHDLSWTSWAFIFWKTKTTRYLLAFGKETTFSLGFNFDESLPELPFFQKCKYVPYINWRSHICLIQNVSKLFTWFGRMHVEIWQPLA